VRILIVPAYLAVRAAALAAAELIEIRRGEEKRMGAEQSKEREQKRAIEKSIKDENIERRKLSKHP
jgi:hypothetical protein